MHNVFSLNTRNSQVPDTLEGALYCLQNGQNVDILKLQKIGNEMKEFLEFASRKDKLKDEQIDWMRDFLAQKQISGENGRVVAFGAMVLGDRLSQDDDKVKESLRYYSIGFEIMENFFGWNDALTLELGRKYALKCFAMNKVDIGIMVGEKVLSVMETIHDDHFCLPSAVEVGIELSRGYEKNQWRKVQFSTLERLSSLIGRKSLQYDAQTVLECKYRVQNMMAVAKYIDGDLIQCRILMMHIVDKIFPEISKQWIARSPSQAFFELGLSQYFLGHCSISNQKKATVHVSMSDPEEYFDAAKSNFMKAKRLDWVQETVQALEKYIASTEQQE